MVIKTITFLRLIIRKKKRKKKHCSFLKPLKYYIKIIKRFFFEFEERIILVITLQQFFCDEYNQKSERNKFNHSSNKWIMNVTFDKYNYELKKIVAKTIIACDLKKIISKKALIEV